MNLISKLVFFVFLLLGGAAGAQSCQALEEAGATPAFEYSNLKEMSLGDLLEVLTSRDLLDEGERASFTSDGEFDPDTLVGASCFGPLLFTLKGQTTLVTYNVAEGRKVSEIDGLSYPVELLPVDGGLYAATLLAPGIGTASAVLNLTEGRVLSAPEFGASSSSSVELTLANRVLVERSLLGQEQPSSGLAIYQVEEDAVRELSACRIDAPPADDYAVSSRGVYALTETSEGVEGRLLSGCQEVGAALLN